MCGIWYIDHCTGPASVWSQNITINQMGTLRLGVLCGLMSVCLAWYMPRDTVAGSSGDSAHVQFLAFLVVALLCEPGDLLLLRVKSFLQDRGCSSEEGYQPGMGKDLASNCSSAQKTKTIL